MADTHGHLISSKDVTGTAVYGAGGDKLGSVDHVMIDKTSGRVEHALVTLGSTLGVGGEDYPVAWDRLTYDTSKNGFTTSLTEDQIKAGMPAA